MLCYRIIWILTSVLIISVTQTTQAVGRGGSGARKPTMSRPRTSKPSTTRRPQISKEPVDLRCYETITEYAEVPIQYASYLVGTDYLEKGKEVIIIIHGYANGHDGYIRNLREKFMNAYHRSKNYCVLNWSSGTLTNSILNNMTTDVSASEVFRPNHEVVTATEDAGTDLGNALLEMESRGVDMKSIYLVAYSEGSHLAGIAGEIVVDAGKTIGRITALDPTQMSDGRGLNKNCAKLVDSIHTNPTFTGIKMPIGHIDFWINYGCQLQPGCTQKEGPLRENYCSHIRALLIMTDAMQYPNSLEGRRADCYNKWKNDSGTPNFLDINYIGPNIIPSNHGSFYLCTNSKSKFGKGAEGMNPKSCKCS